MKKYTEITRGSRVQLATDKILRSFNGELREIKAGRYYITGFWVDMVGLNTTSARGLNEACIQSKELSKFIGITL